MSVPQQRSPRFRRQVTSGMSLTERDVQIIKHIHDHRFLRSTHVIELLDGSSKTILRRLNRLFHHGFLDRPRIQIEYYRHGSKPMVYGLGNHGADVLAERYGVSRQRVDWTQKNQTVGRVFILHTLAVADFMVALACACREHGEIGLITEKEVVAEAPEEHRARLTRSLQWKVNALYDGERYTLGVRPDACFGLHYQALPEGKNRAYFFAEVDRATMSVAARSLKKSSLLKKMIAYHETWRQSYHTELLGIKNFRALFVTTSRERARNAAEAGRTMFEKQPHVTKKGRVLYFGDLPSILETGPLDFPWGNSRDEETTTLG